MRDIGESFIDDERGRAIDALIRLSARWLLADDDVIGFQNRLAADGPELFPDLIDGTGADRAADAGFFRALGWAIALKMPLPQQHFRPRTLALPGRNEACLCGSGRKFKHCCAPLFRHLPDFEPEGLAWAVVDAMPRAQWKLLPQMHMPPLMALATAMTMGDAGRAADAGKLLEPWAALPAPWPDERAELLDLLGDVYVDLDKPRKRKQLARAMIDRGSPRVQSFGWQRLATMAADTGQHEAAQRAFEQAQRLTPDAPRLALLEVTLHWGAGQLDRVRERARFHARRLARLPASDERQHAIDLLERMAAGEMPGGFDADADAGADGDADLAGALALDPDASCAGDTPFDALADWIGRLPAPEPRLDWSHARADDLGVLRPTATAAKALARWHRALPLRAPQTGSEGARAEAPEVFELGTWTDLLAREPLLLDCFEVLDSMLLALDAVPFGIAARLQAGLLWRAQALWQAVRAKFPAALFEWAHPANRPALRLLVSCIELDSSPRAANSFEALRALVEVLNPHDNHGLRDRLAAVYLRRGMAEHALALCERHPDDFVRLSLLRARALLALQRLDEAAAAFDAAIADNPHVGGLLRAKRKPKASAGGGVAVGPADQARSAVVPQWDLWRDDKAVAAWVAQRLDPNEPRQASLV